MCRACDQGGRRCPSDAPELRRSRQNAAYHAKKHTTEPREPESGTDDAASSAGLQPLTGPVTAEMVSERVEHARTILDRANDRPSPVMEGAIRPGERLTQTNDDGWLVPTEYGLEAEAATRAAGAAIAARAEGIAESRMEEALKSDGAILENCPGGSSSREAYADYIATRAHALKTSFEAAQRDYYQCTDREEATRIREKANATVPEVNKLATENARIQQGDGAWDRAEAKVYSDAYLEALSEQRSMGLPDGKMIEVEEKSQKATTKRLEKGLAYYPSDWLTRDGSYETTFETTGGIMGPQQHTERLPLRVTSTSKRAYYASVVEERAFRGNGGVERHRYSELTIDKRDEGCLGPGVSTAVHEYGHRAERIQPRVNDLAQAHLTRRTTTADGQRHQLEPYLVGKRDARSGPPQNMWQYEHLTGKTSEWVRSDDFAQQYTGKQNSARDDSSEVFSTGMEGVFAGRFGGLRGAGNWKEDREHRDFILGTLASVK